MNIPINLSGSRVLFLGIGGGFDIYGAIPLLSYPKHVALANLCIDKDTLIEDRLSLHTQIPVYVLFKAGVAPIRKQIEDIIKKEDIDTIVCVDGGIDSLMTGEEEGAGTILEDTVTMTAVSSFKTKNYLVAVGFGTEMEEGVSHYHALENMAALSDAFLGSCSLVKDSVQFRDYKAICELGWAGRRKSHIHTKVISAVEGMFGEKNLYEGVDARTTGAKEINFTTPLMGVYWFYELEKVVARNKLSKVLEKSNTWADVIILNRSLDIKKKPRLRLPL